MLAANKRVVIVVGVTALAALAYWFLLLSPKQSELAELDDRADQLHASISAAESDVADGLAAQEGFSHDYGQLIALGKAVPDGDEQATLMYQLNRLGLRSNTSFTSIALETSGAPELAAPPEAAAPGVDDEVGPSVTSAPGEDSSGAGEGSAEAEAPAAAPAEEARVASLPIGATVGEAGLATLPYQLEFEGDFFRFADFIGDIDDQVRLGEGGSVAVDGRLMTIDGFALIPGEEGLSGLQGSFSITTFVTPAREGLTAGATPAGPGPGEPVPAANTEGGGP